MRDGTVKVYILPTGSLALPRRWVLAGRDDDNNIRAPDFSFLIEHPSKGTKVLFDLGYRKDFEAYPPGVQALVNIDFPECKLDVVDILAEGGTEPKDIDTVIFSHCHHDHTGDISKFPTSKLILGPGSKSLFPAWPENQKALGMLSAFIQAPSGDVTEYPPDTDETFWKPLEGLWPRTHDFFGDGSFYLLDAPGHLLGHMMGLARTAQDEYIVMGGDACHDPLLFMHDISKYDIGEKHGPGPIGGMHKDPPAARATIEGIRKLHKREDVLVIMAHDYSLNEVVDLFPKAINRWRPAGIKDAAMKVANRIEKEDMDRHRQWLSKGCCCQKHKP